jgi:hypothetical protein
MVGHAEVAVGGATDKLRGYLDAVAIEADSERSQVRRNVDPDGHTLPPVADGTMSDAPDATESDWMPEGVPDEYASHVANAIRLRSGRKNAPPGESWNEQLNNPMPATAYIVDNRFLFVTDARGRTVYVKAILSQVKKTDGVDRRNEGQQLKAGTQYYDQLAQRRVDLDVPDRIKGVDDGGHIVASRFGGIGEAINLIAQNRKENRRRKNFDENWFGLENKVASLLAQLPDTPIDWTVELTYPDQSVRPRSLVATYTQGAAPPVTKRFKNPLE